MTQASLWGESELHVELTGTCLYHLNPLLMRDVFIKEFQITVNQDVCALIYWSDWKDRRQRRECNARLWKICIYK